MDRGRAQRTTRPAIPRHAQPAWRGHERTWGRMRIDPEFQSLIPPLTAEERAGLEESIAREGCRDPLVVWTETETLVDGHNRLEICRRLGKPYNTTGLSFLSRDSAKAWIIRSQFARRNLSPYQKAELALALEPLLRPAAEARMLAGRADPVQNSGEGRVDDALAQTAGVSKDTIHRARVLREKAAPSVLDGLRRGETTINTEYQ